MTRSAKLSMRVEHDRFGGGDTAFGVASGAATGRVDPPPGRLSGFFWPARGSILITMATTPLHRMLGQPRAFQMLARIYPPLLGAGIRVTSISPDWTRGELSMHVYPWNANHNGTAFGGALFSATDVLYGTMLAGQLGGGFSVATKEATVRFLRPGRGRMSCTVEVPRSEADHVMEQLQTASGVDMRHLATLYDTKGRAIVEAEHVLRVKRRK